MVLDINSLAYKYSNYNMHNWTSALHDKATQSTAFSLALAERNDILLLWNYPLSIDYTEATT